MYAPVGKSLLITLLKFGIILTLELSISGFFTHPVYNLVD